jgi:hypothetical protein
VALESATMSILLLACIVIAHALVLIIVALTQSIRNRPD